MARDLPTGIERTPFGYRAHVWVPDPTRPQGRKKSKRFGPETSITEMRQWREDERVAARKPATLAPPILGPTGFAADAATYLEAVRAMPSFKDRVRDIGSWILEFGDTPSRDITGAQIRTARDRWLTVGPKRVFEKQSPKEKPQWVDKAVPLSASAVNHRLRALENMWTVLWPKEPNPVREVPEAEEPEQHPRGQSFAVALEILAFMPDITTPKKNGAVERGSLSRVRFEAMLWTGLPAVQLARLTPELVDWTAGTVLVPRRKKGRRSRRARQRQERPRPLLPQAITALTRLFALGGNRTFSSTSLARSVRRAIRAANKVRATRGDAPIPTTITIYDLTRHTFGTEVFRASKNLKAVQDLLGHSDINQSARYALAAVTEHTAAAVRQTAARMSRQSGNVSGKVSPKKRAGRGRTRRPRRTKKTE